MKGISVQKIEQITDDLAKIAAELGPNQKGLTCIEASEIICKLHTKVTLVGGKP